MMKTIITFLLTVYNCTVFSQDLPPLDLRDSLMFKSKNQKSGAWALLGVGGALTIAGIIVTASQTTDAIFETIDEGEGETSDTGGILIAAGLLAAAGSIPLFIGSHRNKERALNISVNTESYMMPVNSGWIYSLQPAVKLTVPLGRK